MDKRRTRRARRPREKWTLGGSYLLIIGPPLLAPCGPSCYYSDGCAVFSFSLVWLSLACPTRDDLSRIYIEPFCPVDTVEYMIVLRPSTAMKSKAN